MPCSENSYSRMTTALLATRMADMQAGNSVSLKVQQTLIFPLTIWLNVGEVGLKAHFCYNSLYTHFHVTDINRYKYFREGVDLKNRLTNQIKSSFTSMFQSEHLFPISSLILTFFAMIMNCVLF